ncbi:MAG: hypothetical protein ACLFRY_09380 [Spirochaetia bacterium]
MKLITILRIQFIPVFLTVLLLSCAGGPEEKTGTGDEAEYEVSARGRVEELGMTVWMYGTHALVDPETGEVLYALTSDTVVLACYVESVITVRGNLVEGYPVDSGPPYLEVLEVGP